MLRRLSKACTLERRTKLTSEATPSPTRSKDRLWLAWVVLVCALALSFVAWRSSQHEFERQMRLEFEAEVSQVRSDLSARIAGYTQTVRAAAALFATADTVSREDWHNYVSALKLERGYPAIQAVAFARAVTQGELDTLVSDVRNTGVADFAMRPPGLREQYVVNVFAEPYRGLNIKALGYDMWQDADRRETMLRASDAGEPMITRRTTLKVDLESQPVAAFIMFMPVVRKPGAGVYGYVLSPFRMPALMDDLMGKSPRAVALSIHDGTEPRPDNLFYRSADPASMAAARFTHREALQVGGRSWTLAYASRAEFDARAGAGPATKVLAAGLLSSLLLFGVVASLATTRARATQLARDMTSALRKSEESLRITLDSIGDAVITTDTAGRITGMNPVAEKLCGWALADARARPLLEVFHIVHATTRAAATDPVQQVMEQGQVVGQTQHTLLLSKNGQEYQIADSAAPIRNAAASIVGVVLVFSDVTEKYRADQSLQASEQRFRSFFEQEPNYCYEVSPQGLILDVNPSAVQALGYASKDELVGQPFLTTVYAPSSYARARALFRLWTESGELRNEELAVITKNGALRDVVLHVTSVKDKQGQLLHSLSIQTDITERKQAEAKLQLAANVFSHAGEGIMITQEDGTIVDVNQAFSRITGYAREEVLGLNSSILSSGQEDPAFYAALSQALKTTGQWSGEIWNRRKNGEVFAEMLTINAVRDAQGNTQQYVALFSDITAFKDHENELQHIAHFDALTNLPNRVLLADRLQQAMAQAQRRGQQLAVAYLDLDGFKAINDRHGHAIGDAVLVTLASRMKQALRDSDTLARLGGDEFVAVLGDLDESAASVPMLSRLLAAAAEPVLVGGISTLVSASLGVTFYPQEVEIDADQLLRQADQAMYQAKLAGKNRFHVFDAKQDSSMRIHHASLEHIRLALERNEFVLYYQPKVNMRTGQVIGAEALIRWQHPERGLLAPAVFLPVIEEHPMAVTIGEWVINTALCQMERWQAVGLDIGISVNVGARQLQQADFVDRLRAILAAHPRILPARLEIEVLETSALADMAQVSLVIEACAEIGVTFALDDFGTGYSSLTYLKRLRVGMLKIDQSFVRDMLIDSEDLAILQGVIGLAVAFKRQVIAEGVETVAHGTLLLQLGCELAQGYGIARPMPGDALPAWAAAWRPDDAWNALPWVAGEG